MMEPNNRKYISVLLLGTLPTIMFATQDSGEEIRSKFVKTFPIKLHPFNRRIGHPKIEDPNTVKLMELLNQNPQNVEAIKEVIELGANVNIRIMNETPLHIEVKNGNKEMVQFLIEHGADINAKTMFGAPIKLAIEKSDKEIVQLLIDRGVDINAKGRDGTPLIQAIKSGNLDMVQFLIDRNAEINIESIYGTPLIQAIKKGNMEILQLLINHKAEVNAKSRYGKPLIHAIQNKNIKVVQLLINSGAKVTGASLIHAIRNGNMEMVQFLVEHGADVNTKNKNNGLTPLHIAAKIGNADIVQLLLTQKANVNEKTLDVIHPRQVHEKTFDAIHPRIQKRRPMNRMHHKVHPMPQPTSMNQIVPNGMHTSRMWGHDADVMTGYKSKNDKMKQRVRPTIMFAGQRSIFQRPRKSAVKDHHRFSKISNGFNQNNERLEGETPLHFAVRGNHLDIVKLFISAEANINIENVKGKTPLDIANGQEIKELLQKAGGKKGSYEEKEKQAQFPQKE